MQEKSAHHGDERFLMNAKVPADACVKLVRQEIVCKVCGRGEERRKLRICSGCLDVSYCSKRCQRIDWSTHRQECISTHVKKSQGLLVR